MPERDMLLSALTAELLGPRGGIREILQAPPHRTGDTVSPLDEYITGVLAPCEAREIEEIDASDDLLGEDDEAADDRFDAGAPAAPPGVTPTSGPGRSPALDPRARPCSIGLSVLVQGDKPSMEICVTWAWYSPAGPVAWRREPRFDLRSVICTETSNWEVKEPDGIRKVVVQVRSRPAGNAWRVSVFLINATASAKPGPEHYVYQPQIRLHLVQGARLLPLEDEVQPEDQEASSLALLYSARRPLARGHLCAAVWKDVDPERAFDGENPQAPPFVWLDGALLPPAQAAQFVPADARTELLPCYFIRAPQLQDPSRYGATVLDPEQLSELWVPEDIDAALSPLATTYEAWISEQQAGIAELPTEHQPAAQRHLAECREALRRLREGINLLCRDEPSRLAFCFANKSVALQARWNRGAVSPWRPFQLAFQLINLPAIRDEQNPDRLTCDLLWIPTGGGKTEAYLGLAAFTYGLRRLLSRGTNGNGIGVSVLSRYTLRLLTIQQFRRALSLVTASEYLRVLESPQGLRGWRPRACPDHTQWIWGQARFSLGLWVGGNVTPNSLFDFSFRSTRPRLQTVWGALSILRGEEGEGEPAQVLKCPACAALLAVPPEGFPAGRSGTIHFVVECQSPHLPVADPTRYSGPPQPQTGDPLIDVTSVVVTTHVNPAYHTLSIMFQPRRDISPKDVDRWCQTQVLRTFGTRARLVSTRASRPGYFYRFATLRGGRPREVDFELFCPNPGCTLNTRSTWSEMTPTGPLAVPDAFEVQPGRSSRIPIPALTVDDQVYHRCPTMVVSTVDKFARLAFEPRSSSLFGNVDHYCDRHGYYRADCPPNLHPPARPSSHPAGVTPIRVPPLLPPDLILQDELHLIEGPLGSMVGIYETAVETLASRFVGGRQRRPKYLASSATVRKAGEQVQSLYDRRLAQFPASGISIDDNFFSRGAEAHPLDAAPPGRLYVGVCAPGRGAQTPIVRIWSRLLQSIEEMRLRGVSSADLDGFWTLVGYFNAIRELAGVVALVRQDIPERMAFLSATPRLLPEEEPVELSSRADSLALPGLLERLNEGLGKGNPVCSVVTTSMFGTGVDVPRLSLMVVHGQPKTSSAYIQATGRVGRERGGLVITFYRASRPRDLSHYEFFIGYHRELYRHVEPATVNPFSPRARDRALGPVAVAILRGASEVPTPAGATPVQFPWRIQQRLSGGWFCRAAEMAAAQGSPEIVAIPIQFEARASRQPPDRRPAAGTVSNETASEVSRWAQLAAVSGPVLLYQESSMITRPANPVVLGDLAHEVLGLPVAFENAPNSLREVEATTTFKGRP
jgi:hypothetical protein